MTTRQYWINSLIKTAEPVYTSLAQNNLRRNMPVEYRGTRHDRPEYTHLEAVGRSLAGIGPWLELTELSKEEKKQQDNMIRLVVAGLKNAVDKSSPDYLNFNRGNQPVVDAAFLAQGLMRCWNSVWLKLDEVTQQNMINCMTSSRIVKSGFNNWLLFSAMVEAFLCKAGAPWDKMRVDYAIRQHEQWYKGDGIYGDGPDFHWDYYNSYVIQPMYYDILNAPEEIGKEWADRITPVTNRIRRYAAVQERLISPEGTFPPIGRSLAYRYGAFQSLSLVALKSFLPEEVSPAGVRCALTAVIKNMMEREGVYDKNDWLRPGFAGHQPSIGENYISTGSLYLCLCGLLPLGLAESDPFWSEPDTDWTARKIWQGEDLPCDHAMKHSY